MGATPTPHCASGLKAQQTADPLTNQGGHSLLALVAGHRPDLEGMHPDAGKSAFQSARRGEVAVKVSPDSGSSFSSPAWPTDLADLADLTGPVSPVILHLRPWPS